MPIRYVPNFNNNATVTIPNDSITSAKILNGEVKTEDIDNGAVTADKLASSLGTKSFTAISSSQISGSSVTGSEARFTNISGTNITGSVISGTIISGSAISGSQITGSSVSGSNLTFAAATASSITGSTAKFTTISGTYISGSYIGDGSQLINIPNAYTVLGFVSNQVVSTTTQQVVGQVLATSTDFSNGFVVNGIANCTNEDTDLKIALYKYSAGSWTQVSTTQTVSSIAPTTFTITESNTISSNTVYELRAYIYDASTVYDDCFVSFAYIKAS